VALTARTGCSQAPEYSKEFTIDLDVTVSIADLHVMEDFVMEYTDPSVIEQALEDIADSEREGA